MSSDAACSIAIAFLNRIPRCAPSPVPTMIAVGVASPSASGQVMTTTVIANSSASSVTSVDDGVPDEERAQAADERDEDEPEGGAVGEPLRRRLRVLRLLDELDDLRERGVRADGGRAGAERPLLVDRRADQRVARALETGIDSPVTIDSSTELSPSTTSASTGIFAPGRIRSRSPTCTSAVGTSSSLPSRMTTAFGGARSSSARIGVVGAAAGAHLEPVAEEDERGEEGGGLVEDLALDAEGRGDRVDPAGPDRDGDEHHHVERPRPERQVGAPEEDPDE